MKYYKIFRSKHKPYLSTNTTATASIPTNEDEAAQVIPPVKDTVSPTTTTTTTTISASASVSASESAVEEKKLEMSLSQKSVDKQWNLLGPYLGQYIVYTGENHAWLLS